MHLSFPLQTNKTITSLLNDILPLIGTSVLGQIRFSFIFLSSHTSLALLKVSFPVKSEVLLLVQGSGSRFV